MMKKQFIYDETDVIIDSERNTIVKSRKVDQVKGKYSDLRQLFPRFQFSL